jgi:hypothetical protein
MAIRIMGVNHKACAQFTFDALDFSQCTRGYQRARFANHRIAGIAMREEEQPVVSFDELIEALRLGKVAGERLFADDVEPFLHERACYFEMQLGGRGDHHRINAVLTRRFALCHYTKVGIDAIFVDQLSPSGSFRNLGINGHRASDYIVKSVRAHGDKMSAADNGVLSTADEAYSHAPAKLREKIDRHVFHLLDANSDS